MNKIKTYLFNSVHTHVMMCERDPSVVVIFIYVSNKKNKKSVTFFYLFNYKPYMIIRKMYYLVE